MTLSGVCCQLVLIIRLLLFGDFHFIGHFDELILSSIITSGVV